MKKIRLFTLLALILTFALTVLVGCSNDAKVSSIALKDHTLDTVIEMAAGNFDYDSYKLVVSYDDGRKEEIKLSEQMIAEEDLFKFYQVGDHEIDILHSGKTYTFKISVKRSTFGEISFPKDLVFTYDGTPHVVEVEGNIPANAVVTYTGGNSFTNAGTYGVTAIVSCDGYVTEKLSTTVKIEKAKYDMSKVTFEPREFVYDGVAHSVEISGELPQGVSKPTYVINEKITSSATDAGEYTVTARFSNNSPNYEPIPDMTTTLTITPAEYTLKGVDLVFKNGKNKVIDGSVKTYDGLEVTFDLNDYNKLANKVSVIFSVYRGEEMELISFSNKETNIINAGTYTVKAEFVLSDSKNYKPIDPIIQEFVVEKADYPAFDNVQFMSDEFSHDGNLHSLNITGILPEGVTVSYEYYLNGTLVTSDGDPVQAVSAVGRYTVRAIFTLASENYNPIEPMEALLVIK